MPSRSVLATLVVALLAILGPAAVARAQAPIAFAPCEPAGFECGRLGVPVDRANPAGGTISLDVTRRRAAQPASTAVVALAGGPGQAAVPLAESFGEVLAPGLATRDLLVFDQRGTGGSEALSCTALRTSGSLAAVRACSRQLGPRRAFFKTSDSVEDIEALRIAGGYDRLSLHGVSYGTKVALAYAAAHPDRVESLVLDSTVAPEGPDAFRRSSITATPRVVSDLCAGGLCRGISSSAARDLRTVARRLRAGSLRGSVISSTGRSFTARLTEPGLLGVLLAGDLNPQLRAELPGALRAALTGDARPLLRLSARSAGLENAAPRLQSAQAADSDALFLATTCEENPTFPWPHGASLEARARAGVAAARRLTPASVAPFSRVAALQVGYVPICVGWDQASPQPSAAPVSLPAVPTLILDGGQDVRTPVEDATALAARIPGAKLVAVPNVGHSVLGADPTTCASGAVTAFYTNAPYPSCATDAPLFRPTPKPETRLARLDPYGSRGGTVGRTVEALRLTVNDGRNGVLGATLATGAAPDGVGGLRSGSVRVTSGGTLVFRGYEYVPGVRVSGRFVARGTSRFTVSGDAGATGSVTVSRTLAVSGRLGGRRVSARFGQAASDAGPRLSLAQAVRRGKLIAAAAAR